MQFLWEKLRSQIKYKQIYNLSNWVHDTANPLIMRISFEGRENQELNVLHVEFYVFL